MTRIVDAHLRLPAVLFGVPIDDVTMADTIDIIGQLIAAGRSSSRTFQVATVNVDFLVNAVEDAELHHILQHSSLNIADGMPVVFAARRFGVPLAERVTGADLVPRLAEASALHGWRIHLYGSAPGVAERAVTLLSERHPGARITADSGGVISDVSALPANVLDELRSVDADVLCVALGNPKQERFIQAIRAHVSTPVMIGIGGTLDMLVGGKRRAPHWAQRSGLEWAFRAAQEPRRLGQRYAHDARVFFPKARRWFHLLRSFEAGSFLAPNQQADPLRVSISDSPASASRWVAVAEHLAAGHPVTIDLSDGPLRPLEIARLVWLHRLCARHATPLEVSTTSATLIEQFRAMHLDSFAPAGTS